jgi:hypothetical protein
MKIITKGRALLTGAIIAGIASQAALASASVFCRALWPATFTQCQSTSTGDSATGFGSNGAGTTRNLSVTWLAGTVGAQAAVLNSQGQAIAGCLATDAFIDGTPGTDTCSTASASALFITAN